MDDGGSVQVDSVLLSCGTQQHLTLCSWDGLIRSPAHGKLAVPEVGDDPHAQGVVTEVRKRGGIVNPAAVRTKSPILAEVRSFNAGDGKARHPAVTHSAAGRRRDHALNGLLQSRIGLEVGRAS